MAGELVHVSTGGTLSQAQWEAVGRHLVNNQTARDIIYASSASQLSRLGAASRGLGSCITVAASDAPAGALALADFVCDGTADQTEINLAIAAARTGLCGVVKLIGNFYITDSIDATYFRYTAVNTTSTNFCLDLSGASIWANGFTANVPIIDMTGAAHVYVRGGQIWACNTDSSAPTFKPNAGILMGRMTGAPGGTCKFDALKMWGYFTKAIIYSYASEGNDYFGCNLNNEEAAGKGISFNANNPDSIASPFRTLLTGDQSNTVLNFYGGAVTCRVSGGAAVYIQSQSDKTTNNVNFYGTQITSAGTYAIYLDMAGGDLHCVTLDGIRITDSVPTNAIYAGNAGAARVMGELKITGSVITSGTKDIVTGANVTPDKWLVDRTNWFTAAKGYTFAITPTNYDIYGYTP